MAGKRKQLDARDVAAAIGRAKTKREVAQILNVSNAFLDRQIGQSRELRKMFMAAEAKFAEARVKSTNAWRNSHARLFVK